MQSRLGDNLVIVTDDNGTKLHEKSHYGQKSPEGLQLSLIEALFLIERGKIEIFRDEKKISIREMIQIIQNEGLFTKYCVFKDLRNRGYIVKTGFKYGSEFRLYERGDTPGEGHSKYLVKVVSENDEIHASDLSSYVRVAHGVNKKLIMAVVDEEGDITYYTVEWMRP
ncbi:MAG: tRNA-intron lyase [Euryarchaeota archaeon]|nr:tRNA-intron lyase [Euryarchaeota archaeon]